MNGIHDWYHTLTWNIITLICSYTKLKKTKHFDLQQWPAEPVFSLQSLPSISTATCHVMALWLLMSNRVCRVEVQCFFFQGFNGIGLCTRKQINTLPMPRFSTLMVCLASPLWPNATDTKTLWGHKIGIALKLCLSMRAATNEDVLCRLVTRLVR